jgi:hypothetical protein
MPRIHWITRGTGTPKDRDEVNWREVWECDGWVCDLDVIGAPSRLRLTRKAAALGRMLPTRDLSSEKKPARRKWKCPRSNCASWTPEAAKKRSVSRWACKDKSLINSLCNLPDVLAIGGINETDLNGLLLYQIYTFGSCQRTKGTGPVAFARYPASSMSPRCWPRLLTTCTVLTLCVVRKRSSIWYSRVPFWHPNERNKSTEMITLDI